MVKRWKGVDIGVLRGCWRLVLVVPATRWDTLLLPVTVPTVSPHAGQGTQLQGAELGQAGPGCPHGHGA